MALNTSLANLRPPIPRDLHEEDFQVLNLDERRSFRSKVQCSFPSSATTRQKYPDPTNPVTCALPIACSGELSLDGYICTLPSWAVCKILNLLPSPLLLVSYLMSVGISWCTVKVSCLSAMKIPRRCLILYECLVCHQRSLYECFQFIHGECDEAITPDGIRSQRKKQH